MLQRKHTHIVCQFVLVLHRIGIIHTLMWQKREAEQIVLTLISFPLGRNIYILYMTDCIPVIPSVAPHFSPQSSGKAAA